MPSDMAASTGAVAVDWEAVTMPFRGLRGEVSGASVELRLAPRRGGGGGGGGGGG